MPQYRVTDAPSSANWTTRVPAEALRGYGVAELHVVIFAPAEDMNGMRSAMAIQIPEATNALNPAMGMADRDRMRVLLVCDTAKQARRVAAKVSALLPRHRRVPFEKASHGVWSGASQLS